MNNRGTIRVAANEKTGRIMLRFSFPGQRSISYAADLERLRRLVVDGDCAFMKGIASDVGLVQAKAQLDGILAQIEAEFAACGTPTRCEP
jgi:hypothetical protein